MYILKFQVENRDSVYSLLTKKYNVIDYLYPLDVYKKGKNYYITGIHLLEGDPKEKAKFCKELRKNKKVVHFENYGGNAVVLIKEEETFYRETYSAEFFHPSPVIISKGEETWTIGSWDHDKLNDVLKSLEEHTNKFRNLNLQKFGRLKSDELHFPKLLPKIAPQQRVAFQFALANGYYNYPRKKDLKALAKMMGVSLSTYQEHLRRAECKLMPMFASTLEFLK